MITKSSKGFSLGGVSIRPLYRIACCGRSFSLVGLASGSVDLVVRLFGDLRLGLGVETGCGRSSSVSEFDSGGCDCLGSGVVGLDDGGFLRVRAAGFLSSMSVDILSASFSFCWFFLVGVVFVLLLFCVVARGGGNDAGGFSGKNLFLNVGSSGVMANAVVLGPLGVVGALLVFCVPWTASAKDNFCCRTVVPDSASFVVVGPFLSFVPFAEKANFVC